MWKPVRRALAFALILVFTSVPVAGIAGAPTRPPQNLEIRFQVGSSLYWIDDETLSRLASMPPRLCSGAMAGWRLDTPFSGFSRR